MPRWLATQLVDGLIRDDGAGVGIGTAPTTAKLTLANNLATGPLDNYAEYQTLLYNGGTALNAFGLGVRPNTFVLNSGGAINFDVAGATKMTIE